MIPALMKTAAVFDFLRLIALLHAAFFHHPAACRIFHKITCRYLPKSHLTKLADNRFDGFGRISMPLFIRKALLRKASEPTAQVAGLGTRVGGLRPSDTSQRVYR